LSSADGQKITVRPQRTMDCLFVRTQFTVPIPSVPCCLEKFVNALEKSRKSNYELPKMNAKIIQNRDEFIAFMENYNKHKRDGKAQ
jgi:hypothetical protein